LQIDPYSPASADCKTLPSRPYGGPIGPKLPCSCPPGDDAQAVQVVAARHLAPEVAGRQGSRSSSPGEFHPEALTEPCVNLSIHTALHS
jgi:hypothetical protein